VEGIRDTKGGGLMDYMTGDQVLASYRQRFEGHLIEEPYKKAFENGVKRTRYEQVFIRVRKDRFLEAVRHLQSLEPGHEYVHHTVASGSDLGEEIEVLFHFGLYSKSHGHEITVTIGTRTGKDDPHIPTLSDVHPAVTTTEREKQEFLGVSIDGIKDNRRMWLAHAVPVGVYPWRKDEWGADHLVRRVHDNPSGGGDGTVVIDDHNPFPPEGPPRGKTKPRKGGGA